VLSVYVRDTYISHLFFRIRIDGDICLTPPRVEGAAKKIWGVYYSTFFLVLYNLLLWQWQLINYWDDGHFN